MSISQLCDVSPADVEDGIHYPSSDGRPMAETEFHVLVIMDVYNSLELLFTGRDDIYFAANMFLYYERGNAKARKSPDVFVVFGVPRQPPRRSFKTWVERAVPAVIFEITSKKTRKQDWVDKKALYARLRVKEYFLFDPLHDYQKRQLMGFRLAGGKHVPIQREEDGSLASEILGVRLSVDGYLLRFTDSRSWKPIPHRHEMAELAEEATRRAEQERQRAEAAEAELTRLREQLRPRRKGNGRNG